MRHAMSVQCHIHTKRWQKSSPGVSMRHEKCCHCLSNKIRLSTERPGGSRLKWRLCHLMHALAPLNLHQLLEKPCSQSSSTEKEQSAHTLIAHPHVGQARGTLGKGNGTRNSHRHSASCGTSHRHSPLRASLCPLRLSLGSVGNGKRVLRTLLSRSRHG